MPQIIALLRELIHGPAGIVEGSTARNGFRTKWSRSSAPGSATFSGDIIIEAVAYGYATRNHEDPYRPRIHITETGRAALADWVSRAPARLAAALTKLVDTRFDAIFRKPHTIVVSDQFGDHLKAALLAGAPCEELVGAKFELPLMVIYKDDAGRILGTDRLPEGIL